MIGIGALNGEDLSEKNLLIRVDFNIPIINGKLENNYRLLAHKPTINLLLERGAKILLLTHHSQPDFSFENIINEISILLGHKIIFIPNVDKIAEVMSQDSGRIFLLDNLRQNKEEIENDSRFAKKIASGFDLYINDAFSVCHREHSSVVAMTGLIPTYAGPLIEKEVESLSSLLSEKPDGKTLILGGGKISTKLPLINNFLDKAKNILIGGAIANNFFKAQGVDVGSSVVDDKYIQEIKSLIDDPRIILPEDFLITDNLNGNGNHNYSSVKDVEQKNIIVDIGPQTVNNFVNIIKNSKTIIWNGPMGIFENDDFSKGTEGIIKAVEAVEAHSVIGGGDTISAFNKFGALNNIDFVSTGGGAMLKFLAGDKLPGLEALGYYR